MKTVKVVFTRTKGLFPWGVRLVTRSYFNHVAIVYPNSYTIEADKREGVVIKHISKIRGEIDDSIEFTYDIPDELYAAATLFGIKRVGRKYDWQGIIGCLIGVKELYNPDKYYCSRLVRDWLFLAGVHDDLPLHNINPQQLFSLLLKQKGNH